MYSVKGRNLRDAHEFNGGQKIAKPIVTNRGFFENFVSFHSFIHCYKKHTLFNKFQSQKRQAI